MEWQPIETAPRDGTNIDVWVVSPDGEGRRVVYASWGPCQYDPCASTREGQGITVGWCHWGEMYGDGFIEHLEAPQDGDVVSHWMPIPAAPAETSRPLGE